MWPSLKCSHRMNKEKNHATYHIFIVENTHISISFAKSHKKKKSKYQDRTTSASTADSDQG